MKANSSNAPDSSKETVMKIEEHDRVSSAMVLDRFTTPSSASCHAESGGIQGQKSSNIMLPDLNMMPSELEFSN